MIALEGATAAKSTTPQPFSDAQVVVLRVQGGDYAVPINRVQEIVRVPEITRVPHAHPEWKVSSICEGGCCQSSTWPHVWRLALLNVHGPLESS